MSHSWGQVSECIGRRFYDWQLNQSAKESWRECHLHTRNLLGAKGYQALIDEIEGKVPPPTPAPTPATGAKKNDVSGQGKLFETEHFPVFDPKE